MITWLYISGHLDTVCSSRNSHSLLKQVEMQMFASGKHIYNVISTITDLKCATSLNCDFHALEKLFKAGLELKDQGKIIAN